MPRRVREVDEQLLYMRSTSQWSQTVDQSTAGFVFRSLDDGIFLVDLLPRSRASVPIGFYDQNFYFPSLEAPPIISSFISSAPTTRWEIVFRRNIWGYRFVRLVKYLIVSLLCVTFNSKIHTRMNLKICENNAIKIPRFLLFYV